MASPLKRKLAGSSDEQPEKKQKPNPPQLTDSDRSRFDSLVYSVCERIRLGRRDDTFGPLREWCALHPGAWHSEMQRLYDHCSFWFGRYNWGNRTLTDSEQNMLNLMGRWSYKLPDELRDDLPPDDDGGGGGKNDADLKADADNCPVCGIKTQPDWECCSAFGCGRRLCHPCVRGRTGPHHFCDHCKTVFCPQHARELVRCKRRYLSFDRHGCGGYLCYRCLLNDQRCRHHLDSGHFHFQTPCETCKPGIMCNFQQARHDYIRIDADHCVPRKWWSYDHQVWDRTAVFKLLGKSGQDFCELTSYDNGKTWQVGPNVMLLLAVAMLDDAPDTSLRRFSKNSSFDRALLRLIRQFFWC